MAKRKAEYDAAIKHSKTPKKNIEETEFSAEFANDENSMKGANRNSKHGKEGRGKEAPVNVEFGIEFGDLNASKQYEVPYMNREKAKKKK